MGQIIAFYNAVKVALNVVKIVSDLYDKWKARQIDKHYENKKKRREAIVKLMEAEVLKDSPSDEILRDLHYKLNNLGG